MLRHSIKKFGSEFVEVLRASIHANNDWDDREKSLRIADALMIQCQELAPAIVLLYAPPYYPPVNSSSDEHVGQCVAYLKQQGLQEFSLPIQQIHYFNGICDLSYVNYQEKGGRCSKRILLFGVKAIAFRLMR